MIGRKAVFFVLGRQAWGCVLLAAALVSVAPSARASEAGPSARPAAATALRSVSRMSNGPSAVRVLTYNTLDASFDGQEHPGGRSASFARRLPKQLDLLRHSGAAVMGIEEANACLHRVAHSRCWRQIDALNRGLPHLRLTRTPRKDYYTGDYILYRPATLTALGRGGDWAIGPRHPSHDDRYAAYQRFAIKGTTTRFLYVVVHTLAPPGRSYDAIRGQEVQEMVDRASAYSRRHGIVSVLYVGDFNSYRGEYHVDDLSGKVMRAAGVRDGIAVAKRRVDATYDSINAFYRRPRRGHGSADHIYVTRGIQVRTWGELLDLVHGEFRGVIPSDHNPVYADVVIPSG